MLQDHTVVEGEYLLEGFVGAFLAQEMQDAGGQHGELPVLHELAQDFLLSVFSSVMLMVQSLMA